MGQNFPQSFAFTAYSVLLSYFPFATSKGLVHSQKITVPTITLASTTLIYGLGPVSQIGCYQMQMYKIVNRFYPLLI